jgi:FdhE protein
MESAASRWLAAHPYLGPLARLNEALDGAGSAAAIEVPPLDAYIVDYEAGVPLLRSAAAAVDVGAAAPAVAALAGAVADAEGVPEKLRADAAALRQRLRSDAGAASAALASAAQGDADALPAERRGLMWLLAWTALARSLAPAVEAFAAWRLPRPWTQPDCPTCGAPPLLAQLSGTGYRERAFSCAPCRTRWGWKRIGCPHCGNESQSRLGLLELEGEPVRLDVCDACKGYLKTYTGSGDEAFFLADWTTLHLDLFARERGYERRGASLYEP